MLAAIRSEFRKLLTIRSTYVIVLITFLLFALFSFYATGMRADEIARQNPTLLSNEITNTASVIAILGAIVALLVVSHEYRYNTVVYTLTSARRRWHMFAAKSLVISAFMLFYTSLFMVLAPLMVYLGVKAAGNDLVSQTIYYNDVVWSGLYHAWGFAMLAALIAFIVRNQVGAIVAFFIWFSTVESLLVMLLKDYSVYLPFNSLSQVIGQGGNYLNPDANLSATEAFRVSMIWIVLISIAALALLQKRDAN